MHSCSNSLAIESLLLNRPSYIRVKVIMVTLRQPPDASNPRSMLTVQKLLLKRPSNTSHAMFSLQLCQETQTPTQQPLDSPCSTMLFWRRGFWEMILEKIFQVCARCTALGWCGQVQAAVARMHCQARGIDFSKCRVCASAWRKTR